jgi:hypothetical protein
MLTADDLLAALNPKLTILDVLNIWFIYTPQEKRMLMREGRLRSTKNDDIE